MQAKQEPSDPASSPEVMKTLVVGALIWSKGRGEGILLPQDVKVACRKIGGLEKRGLNFLYRSRNAGITETFIES